MTTCILRISGLELHSSGTELITFFGAQSSLVRGTILVWGARPRNASLVAPGLVKSLFWFYLQTKKEYTLIFGEDLFFLNLTKESHVDQILSTNFCRRSSKPHHFLVRANQLIVVRAQPTIGTTGGHFEAVPT